MDYIDAPNMSMKHRSRPQSKNNFQSELQNKLKARRKQGLTADITSEESDGIPEDTEEADDGEDGIIR